MLVVGVALMAVSVQANAIWPQVAESKFGNTDVTLIRNVEFVTQGGNVKTLTAAYERYNAMMFPHATGEGVSGTITTVQVEVDDLFRLVEDLN